MRHEDKLKIYSWTITMLINDFEITCSAIWRTNHCNNIIKHQGFLIIYDSEKTTDKRVTQVYHVGASTCIQTTGLEMQTRGHWPNNGAKCYTIWYLEIGNYDNYLYKIREYLF